MYSFVWTDSDQSLFEYYSEDGTYLINWTERLLLANNNKRGHVYLKVKCVISSSLAAWSRILSILAAQLTQKLAV